MATEFEIIEGAPLSDYLQGIIDFKQKAIERNPKAKVKFVSDRKDPNYELPLSNLYKEY